jgi:hypothetical protein
MKKEPNFYEGLEDSHIIQKSRPLIFMQAVPFSLGELKVLDVYLSRINSHNEKELTVRFSKEEYESLMGIERMHPERLEKYVKNLMGHTVSVPDKTHRKGWRIYTLFDMADCFQDKNEQWWIDLSCTPNAKKLFFNVESVGYIRYRLQNILPLTSKYSILLYIYLLYNRFRNKWLISVEELKSIVFRCNDIAYYEDFKNFKREVLSKSLAEVNTKTNITFEISTTAPGCKAGRRIKNIEFKLIKDELDIKQLSHDVEPLTDEDKEEKYDNHLKFIAGACDYEFGNDEMQMIMSTVLNLPTDGDKHSKDLQRYNFVMDCYRVMNYHDKNKKPIKKINRFSYLRKIIKNKIKQDYDIDANL